MNIAISNIAWDIKENDAIADVLNNFGIVGLEIAPTKIWPNPINTNEADILSYKSFWGRRGIKIVAMQSLLFGHPELTIFESEEKRNATIKYLEKIIRLASMLDIKALVFGSPKNRVIGNLKQDEADEIANSFFSKIGSLSKNYEVHFCIEANPKVYGTDFLNTTNEVITFVRKFNHPYINVHLDSGTMQINKENFTKTIKNAQPFYHFHISEPNLLSVPHEVNHKLAADTLRKIAYKKWVSVEMRSLANGSNVEQIKKTLAYVTKIYR